MKKIIIILCVVLIIGMFMSCGTAHIFRGLRIGWDNYVPASTIPYELKFLWRVNYLTDKEFVRSIAYRVDYLERHGYKIIGMNFYFGYTMERNLIQKFCVIYYHKIKEK